MDSVSAQIERGARLRGRVYDPEDVDIRTLPETIARTRRDALQFLASPAGERWRRRAAWVLVVALPLAFRIPLLRKHWALRFLELAGGAAILVKLGQAVRDWEPSPAG